MNSKSFRAWVVHETSDQNFSSTITQRQIENLPDGDVLIRVHYSSINYKDMLSYFGHKGITRQYPHTPGVDAAGIVEWSHDQRFHPGQSVIVTGYDLGMNTDGGFGEFIRVPADWVIPKPKSITLQESMCYGTAGFTAALSLINLEQQGYTPERSPILVTGATGGVGSCAVALLSHCGYRVVAATGKSDQQNFLKNLGATEIMNRHQLTEPSTKGLLKARWAGAIDTVGGPILTNVIKSVDRRASVTCCGLVASAQLELPLYPFLIRGVKLLGIDSAETPLSDKKQIWNRLATDWKTPQLFSSTSTCTLEEIPEKMQQMRNGTLCGRIILKHHIDL